MNRFPQAPLVAGVAMLMATLCLTTLEGQTKQGAPKGGGKQGGKQGTKQAATPAAAAKPRGPLTRADVERMWKESTEDFLLNEMRLRGLGFEPEEVWLSGLNQSDRPRAAAELKKAIPDAPPVEVVTSAAADLLSRVKAAAQKRDEEALKTLLHPELLATKAKVYDLFDTTNYQNHTLGRFNPAENRRVGVQFFQLTTSQVERLHYVQFATSRGQIVVRDVVTGPAVADLFLKDEKALAVSKLDLVFRAFNDGDDIGLRNLCTPGLYENLKNLAGGTRLTRGGKLSVNTVQHAESADLDHKSIRVVSRVLFTSPGGLRIEFDTDFERIGNDLKLVRLRDVFNKVIAWDPNMDNYLNRRYGLPDGPVPNTPALGMTELIHFQGLPTIRQLAEGALYAGDIVKIQECARELTESLANSGEGHGLRVAAYHLTGKYAEARQDAVTTLDRGGVAYFAVLRHKANETGDFSAAIIGITKGKLMYRAVGGDTSEPSEIEFSSIKSVGFEKPASRMLQLTGRKGKRAVLVVDYKGADGKEHDFKFLAFGSSCKPGPNLVLYTGGDSACGAITMTNKNNPQPPSYVRADWQQNLLVIQQALEDARKKSGGK